VSTPAKLAVVLFNLGGPDGPEDVQPFLRNLFRDPAIISAPGPIRELLAWFISTRRSESARANYAHMGGGSPLLPETRGQADALTSSLRVARPDLDIRVFIAMRYWSPFVEDTARDVRDWQPDDTVLLPLYPQFSTTTTGSSFKAWSEAAPEISARGVCCYPQAVDFIRAHAEVIETTWRDAGTPANMRVLFSAHGLPEKTIEAGDPYQWQIEQTAAAIAALLPDGLADAVICYQSRVGPMTWIGPSTDDEIRRAGADGKAVLVCPIAFVSEHVETLVELDKDYAIVARQAGVETYLRAPALGASEAYIMALRDLALTALEGAPGLKPPGGRRICPANHSACPCAATATRNIS